MFFADPFAPFDELLTRSARRGFPPAMDIAVSDGDMVLTMDLPGMTPDDLQIEVLDGHLVVRGERRRPDTVDNLRWAHSERAFGSFERRVKLPDGVDPDAIAASMDHGVLSLIVPKPERLQPRTISIQSGDRHELTESSS